MVLYHRIRTDTKVWINTNNTCPKMANLKKNQRQHAAEAESPYIIIVISI